MYLISPLSVKLDWFSSEEALELDDSKLVDQTYFLLTEALIGLGIEYSQNDLELCKVGDPSSCLRFLHFIKRLYEQSVDCKIAPSAEKMDINDVIKKEILEEPIIEADYMVSQVFIIFKR